MDREVLSQVGYDNICLQYTAIVTGVHPHGVFIEWDIIRHPNADPDSIPKCINCNEDAEYFWQMVLPSGYDISMNKCYDCAVSPYEGYASLAQVTQAHPQKQCGGSTFFKRVLENYNLFLATKENIRVETPVPDVHYNPNMPQHWLGY